MDVEVLLDENQYPLVWQTFRICVFIAVSFLSVNLSNNLHSSLAHTSQKDLSLSLSVCISASLSIHH